MPRLSDQEKQDVIRHLQADKPLPEKYRFLLFDDHREVELVWNGKTSEVTNVVLPFQTIEHVDEPRAEGGRMQDAGGRDKQSLMFDLDARGRQLKGWTNKLIWGDNKLILSSLLHGPLRDEIEREGGLKLIYIDPPFDVGADFSMDIAIPSATGGDDTFTKNPSILEEIAYRDTWGKGADSFIAMIYERLILMRDLLAENGSIYVHCDWRVNGYMRMVLDEVFGKDRFLNHVIWGYKTGGIPESLGFSKKHDDLLAFTRNETAVFNQLTQKSYVPTLPEPHTDSGKRLGVARDQICELCGVGEPGQKYRNVIMRDVWDDIQSIFRNDEQGTGYATQKPEALAERIVRASSNEGDLVADFFCGSGTMAAVAEKLGRKWIVADLGKFAIHTTRKRMIGVQRSLKAEGRNYRAFEILNLGKYERAHFVGINPNLREAEQEKQLAEKEAAFVDLILRAYRAEPVANSPAFHGKRGGRMVVVGPVNLPVTRRFVEEIILECRKRNLTKVDILGFEFEMGLFPNVLDDAREKGIDIAPKYIPAEVFDKRAVEKNQVVF
ncbi:MAG: site-specific DNA-methyltransferase, partial [Pirellulales bacterium]|nr:site-specific DNA-methyltransferase [Pirellulales bacterium]